MIEIGIDPETGKRRQKTKNGFINKEEAVKAAAALLQELNLGTYIAETDKTFCEFANVHVTQEMKKEAPQKFSELMRSLF